MNGYAGAATAETIGSVTVNSGGSTISLNPGSAGSAALTIAGATPFARSPGGTLNFANTASTVSVPNMAAGFIGPWATIGSENNGVTNGSSLDWAVVNASHQIVPMPAGSYTTGGTGTWTSTSDVKLSVAGTLSAATTIHTLYVTGGGTMSLSGNTLTLAGGGILAYGGTGSYVLSGAGMPTISNAVLLGNSSWTSSSGSGYLTVPTGIPDLVVNASGNLAMNVKNVVDAPNPTGSFTAQTANGSNVVTLTAGNTTQLCAGDTVSGLVGSGITPTITGIVDSTHFTIAAGPTSGAGARGHVHQPHRTDQDRRRHSRPVPGQQEHERLHFYGPAGSQRRPGPGEHRFGAAGCRTRQLQRRRGRAQRRRDRHASTATWNLNRGITVGPQGGTVSLAGAGGASVPWRRPSPARAA